MALSDRIVANAARVTSTRELGETLTYRPAAGGSSSVTATVRRLGFVADEHGGHVRRRAEIFLSRDATVGVTTVADGDRIDLAWTIGAAAETARIVAVLDQDVGGFLVAVEG